MAGRRLAAVSGALVQHGQPAGTPAALVMAGTAMTQRVVTGTLGDIAALAAAAGVSTPANLFVGAVVALRDQLEWFKPAAAAAAYNAHPEGAER